jgi:eukaryotic-like serine/threonine-protein kinase
VSRVTLDLSTWENIEGYLDTALDLAPEQREEWLTALATTAPSIAETIRQLLAEDALLDASGFLEHRPPIWAAAVMPDAVMAGKRIGAYTLERPIGRGGMGEVWVASRNDGRFEGRCAIKFLDNSLAQPLLADRFRHEGRVLARLTHPNIARLVDAGTTDNGRPYLVLEYVDGEPIDQYCEARSLCIEERVQLFLDVVSAVAHAHANLIIHRDLKPSNVLVTRDGVVKLLDFGVAKLLSPDLTDGDPATTRFECIALTPEYAAPEQLLGEVPSTATDVYQLGMLLYVLLTGRHPLPSTGGRAERIKSALDGRLPRASDFGPESVRKELRGDLDAILSMTLRRQPGERYSTAAALREELLRYLNSEAVIARRGAALYAARKFVRRHRFAVLGSVTALVSLCAALAFAFTQARMAATERDRAFSLAARNEAVEQFMGTVITEAAESDKPVTVSDMLARSEKLALIDTSDNRESRAAVLSAIGSDYQSLGDHGKAKRLVEDALTVLGDSSDSELRTELICDRAVVMSEMGQFAEARRSISEQLEHLPKDPRHAAECLHDRSLVAEAAVEDSEENPEVMLRYATEALARLRSAGQFSAAREALFLETVASAYHLNNRNKDAFDYYSQALRKIDALGRSHSPIAIIIRNNWGLTSVRAGTPRRALALFDETLALLTERDQERPAPYYVLLNRARALQALGRYDSATEAYRAAVQRATESQNKYAHVAGLLGLAETALQMGDTSAAAGHVAEATNALGPDEPPGSLASKRLALQRANLAVGQGKIDAARRQFAQTLSDPRDVSLAIDSALGKARAELLAGDPDSSAADARLALSSAESLQAGLPYSNRTGLSWLMLGRALQGLGDDTQAHKAYQAAIEHLSNSVDPDHPALLQARNLAALVNSPL